MSTNTEQTRRTTALADLQRLTKLVQGPGGMEVILTWYRVQGDRVQVRSAHPGVPAWQINAILDTYAEVRYILEPLYFITIADTTPPELRDERLDEWVALTGMKDPRT